MAESYLSRGVSPTKDDVEKAIKNQDKGIAEGAFCKIIENPFNLDDYGFVMHADGAGTKSTIAYIQYKETGDASIFKCIAQDSLVMNIDDLLCVGVTNNFVLSNTIGRNAHRVDATVLTAIIEGYDECISKLGDLGISVITTGGETADVGDLVQTIIVDSTVCANIKKDKIINCANIKAGNVIVGLSSFGQASYESTYNSGIGSNGFTAARHLLLSKKYAETYPETYSNTISKDKVYCGNYMLTDKLPGTEQTIGEALLSPTRTYVPIIKKVLDKYENYISGIIHCTGGGQIKCQKFGTNLHYIKDNLFNTPPIFNVIAEKSKIGKEMYQIFNMGHRLELYCSEQVANDIINISKFFDVDAKVIGHVEENDKERNKVTISDNDETYIFQ